MRRHAPTATRTPSGYAPEEDDDADALGSALGAATAGAFAAGLPLSRRPSMLDIWRWGRRREGAKVVRVVAGLRSDLKNVRPDLAGLRSIRSEKCQIGSDNFSPASPPDSPPYLNNTRHDARQAMAHAAPTRHSHLQGPRLFCPQSGQKVRSVPARRRRRRRRNFFFDFGNFGKVCEGK